MSDASTISAFSSLAGGAGQAYGQYASGQQSSRLSNFSANIAHMQEFDAIQRGDVQAGELQARANLLRGKQTASAAGQGVDVTAGGTVQQIAADTETMSALDAATIRINARREAFGYGVQEADARYRAGVERMRGRNEAFSTLLTSGNKAASVWGKDSTSADILAKRDLGQQNNGWFTSRLFQDE